MPTVNVGSDATADGTKGNAAVMERALTMYRTNMAKYKMSGNASFKTAADTSRDWIIAYTKWLENSVNSDAKFIDNFVKEYSTTNPDLVEMQKKIKKIKVEGPQLEDTHLTDKEAAETDPIDLSPYYTKGGVILGVAALVAVLSFF